MTMPSGVSKQWSCDTLAAGDVFLQKQLECCLADQTASMADKLAVSRVQEVDAA